MISILNFNINQKSVNISELAKITAEVDIPYAFNVLYIADCIVIVPSESLKNVQISTSS